MLSFLPCSTAVLSSQSFSGMLLIPPTTSVILIESKLRGCEFVHVYQNVQVYHRLRSCSFLAEFTWCCDFICMLILL